VTVTMEPEIDITDSQQLRRAFGAFATGVTVVTVGGPSPHGMTANSFASVSLGPPLVLFCVARDAVMHHRLLQATSFGVSVLSAGQERVARHFADRSRHLGTAQFDTIGWRPGRLTGVPLIEGALVDFECELWRVFDGGDHTIVTGKLLAIARSFGDALVFFDGRFHELRSQFGRRATEVTA
jgi:flavin reductase (DIM6/NTAB) family NADH-FMN oxidoreductase RutF